VGNIEEENFRPLLKKYLASIPTDGFKHDFNEVNAIPYKINAGAKKTVYKGKENKSAVFFSYHVMLNKNDTITEKQILTAYLLRDYLDIILTDEIREKMGGVYSISVDANLSNIPPPGELSCTVSFYCDPDKAEDIILAVQKQIELLAAGNINTDAFTKSVSAALNSYEENLQSNGWLASRFATNTVHYNTPIYNVLHRAETYKNITPADMANVARRIVTVKPVTVILYPEK
jgi:zinc protease